MTYIHTYRGNAVNIENPQLEVIDIEDIAHALAFLCRGGGHTKFFFPVARHCVYCAKEAQARGYSNEVVLACLLHDASEAYMVDLPSPIKDNLFPEYRNYEGKVLECVYRKFIGRSLTDEELRLVDDVDHTLLMYDLKYLLNMDVTLPEIHIELKYEFEPFERSYQEYLNLFQELTDSVENV
ncbi:MAG: hypothetical protein IJ486_03430 [Firmicutes bacterium]|nr:hypothetical protein [Bacillota bacterium]